jgi:hypothetical protein
MSKQEFWEQSFLLAAEKIMITPEALNWCAGVADTAIALREIRFPQDKSEPSV